MTKREANQIERMARTHGLEDFKWIQPKMIVTGYWVRANVIMAVRVMGKEPAVHRNFLLSPSARSFLQNTNPDFCSILP